MSMNLSDIAILNIKGVDYHFIISGISKSEAKKVDHYKTNFILTYKNEYRNFNLL